MIACLCEGNAERAIIDQLLNHDRLIFSRMDLLEEEVLKCRSAGSFQKNYLNKSIEGKIRVYRILDSRNENFNLTGPYREKVEEVIDVITAPEIEMLIIHAESCYDDYARKQLKPSAYVNQHMGLKNIKSYQTVFKYFNDIELLKKAIHDHHSKTQNKKDTIHELILKK